MTQAKGPLHAVHFRRRREGKTDYEKRLALLKSRKTRMVVRKTNARVIAQFVEYDAKGDKTIASADSKELTKQGFPGKCNAPSAYLVGALAAKKASAKGVKDFVLDTGRHEITHGGIIFAALKGALDAGLQAPHSPECIPKPERIEGKHLKQETQTAFASAKQKILAK
ncbi:50S ribosomal protein L18 [Candidatus Micrarchaeota archaeon]|nr:50S ribosomal protein L18 [Candidatus Micrarchaeota archaeon]